MALPASGPRVRAVSLLLPRFRVLAALLVAMVVSVAALACAIAARRHQAPVTPGIATWTISGGGSGDPIPQGFSDRRCGPPTRPPPKPADARLTTPGSGLRGAACHPSWGSGLAGR